MSDELKNGTRLSGGARGEYIIDGVLGRGGFGITYSGHDTQGLAVAIKEFFPRGKMTRDEDTNALIIDNISNLEVINQLRNRFIAEGINLSRLRHESVVTIIEMFEDNGTAYMVMELIEGITLKQLVKQSGPLSPDRATRIGIALAQALGYLHANRITHLDVKPDNIIMSISGQPVLIDFGLSHQYDSRGASDTKLIAAISPGYTAIEQYDPKPIFEPRSDVYSLGATLFFMVTGRTPHEPTAIIDSPELIQLDNSVPVHLRAAVSNAMEFRAERRITNMGIMVQVLLGNTTTPDNVRRQVSKKTKPHPTLVVEDDDDEIRPPKRKCFFINFLLVSMIFAMVALTNMVYSGRVLFRNDMLYQSGFYGVMSALFVLSAIALFGRARFFKWFVFILSLLITIVICVNNIV